MNKDILLELIKQDINDLQKIISQFHPSREIHPLEIDLCNNKIKNLAEELQLLVISTDSSKKPIIPPSSAVPEPVIEAAKPEPLKPLVPEPVIEAAKPEPIKPIVPEPVIDAAKPEPIKPIVPEPVIEAAKPEPIKPVVPEPVVEAAKPEPIKPLVPEPVIEVAKPEHVKPIVPEPAIEAAKPETVKPVVPEPVIEVAKPEPVKPVVPEPVQERVKSQEKPKHSKVLGEELGSDKKSLFEILQETQGETDLASQFKTSRLDDINKGIPLNDRIWFIRELFQGNSEDYQHTIEQLNKQEDLESAIAFIQSKYNWDAEEKSVQKFLRIINRRFI